MTLPDKPSYFLTRIGGFFGSYSDVIFYGVHGEYRFYDGHKNPKATESFAPSQQQWAAFLSKLKIWNWHEEYQNPGIYDGTFWKIEITWGNIHFISFGDNNYPGKGGLPSNDTEAPPSSSDILKLCDI